MTFQILTKIIVFYGGESLFFKVKKIKKNAVANSHEKQMNKNNKKGFNSIIFN